MRRNKIVRLTKRAFRRAHKMRGVKITSVQVIAEKENEITVEVEYTNTSKNARPWNDDGVLRWRRAIQI